MCGQKKEARDEQVVRLRELITMTREIQEKLEQAWRRLAGNCAPDALELKVEVLEDIRRCDQLIFLLPIQLDDLENRPGAIMSPGELLQLMQMWRSSKDALEELKQPARGRN